MAEGPASVITVNQPAIQSTPEIMVSKTGLSSSEHEDDAPDQPLLSDTGTEDSTVQQVLVVEERQLTTTLDLRTLNKLSNTQSMMHLLKGNIGTGILAMPVAVKYAGLWVGTIGIAVIGCIAVHCMHLLVQSTHRLCRRYGRNKLDYSEVVEQAVYGFYQSETIAKVAKFTVDVFLCITQFGFCIVYILFVAENIEQFTKKFVQIDLNIRIYQTAVTVCLIPFCWVKSLKYLAPFSMFANVLTVVGLLIILQYCVRDLPPYFIYPAFAGVDTLPLFFGIVIYAFEGISLVLPIENKMRSPQDFRGLTGVLNTGMVIVSVLYVAVGFYGFMKFGTSESGVEGSITLNMPTDYWLYLSIKLVFAAAIFISYAVQFYVPAIILIPSIEKELTCVHDPAVRDCIIRTLFVLGTYVISIIIPHLDLMISLIGALSSSALALIFPPLIDTLVLWPDCLGRWKWRLVKNIAIALFGFIGFVLGTATSLIKIIQAFEEDSHH